MNDTRSDRGPFDDAVSLLPDHLRRIVERDTPIPTIAQRAAERAAEVPGFVRADIGQISGLNPDAEVLYGPPSGLPPLRAAVAELWQRSFQLDKHGVTLSPENVAITTGAAEAVSLTFAAFAHGRRVAVPLAHWENYSNGVDAANGEVIPIEYFEPDGSLDTAALAKKFRDADVDIVVANFPANPTGAVLTVAEAEAFAAAVREVDAILICDEVYARLRFDDAPPLTLLAFAPERTVVVSSASKEYLLPGARIGYAICAHAIVPDRILRKLTRAHTASPNVLGQRRLLEVIEEDLEDLRAGRDPRNFTPVRDAMRVRRDRLVSILEKHGMPMVGRAAHTPSGTIFLCCQLPEWWSGSDFEFVESAIDRGAFSAIPGSAFGLDRAVRFSLGGLDEDAIARLDRGLEAFAKDSRS